MSRKDKRVLFFLCIITSILLSLILNDIYFRYRYGIYIIKAYENSIEAIRSLERIDSTYIID